MAETRRDHRQEMTDAIIKELSQGTLPWQKPWPQGLVKERPRNDFTGTQYKGINQVSLEMAGYGDPRWMTFKQAQAHDYRVKKGAKSRRIEYWSIKEIPIKEKVVNPETNEVEEKETIIKKPIGNSFAVFNAEDIEGIAPYYDDLTKHLPEKELNERAETLLKRTNAKIMFDSPGEAFYDKHTKVIHASPRHTYNSTYDMYSSLLHQLAHWTSFQMDRKVPDITEDKEGYMREELRVELACYFMAHDLGIGSTQDHIKSHASYIAPWVKMLKLNKNEIYRAAKEANKIYDFLMDYVPEYRLDKKNYYGETWSDGSFIRSPEPKEEPIKKEEKPKPEEKIAKYREDLVKENTHPVSFENIEFDLSI